MRSPIYKRFEDCPFASVEHVTHDSTGAQIDRDVEKFRYPSMESFLSWFEQTPRLSPSAASENNKIHFCGTPNITTAIALARYGWYDLVDNAKALSASLFDMITSHTERPDIVYDVEGIGIDIARYLDGVPESWQKWESTIVAGQGIRHIRLLFNCMTSGGVNGTSIAAKGAAICALSEALEYNNVRVEIVLCALYRGMELYITIKTHDQPIDMPRLLFALAHPSMQRRLEFGFIERHPDYQKLICGGGFGGNGREYWWREVPSETSDIYIPQSFLDEPQWTNTDSTVAWCLAQMSSQGVKLSHMEDLTNV